ncbi:hypothetical protein [Roseivirga echinicomitans]
MCFLTLGCDYTFPEPSVDDKAKVTDADLSKSVFVGGTLFSGLQDGALTTKSIENSVPNIFFNQIYGDSIAEMDFSPKVASENGFNIFENQSLTSNIGRYKLVYPTPDTADFTRVNTLGDPFAYQSPSNATYNFSFPKAQILDFTEANRNANPFLADFFGNTNRPMINEATDLAPTFFVLNLGFEDLLAYAINGAEGNQDQGTAASHVYGDIISEALFEAKLNEVINAFYAANPNAKGALMNIPNFLNFPYFIEVRFDITPYVIKTPLYNKLLQKANMYNNELENYYLQNPSIPYEQRRTALDFASDRQYNWGILVTDRDMTNANGHNGQPLPKVRHAERDERIFISTETKLNKSKGHFPENALSESEYLKRSELVLIKNKISAFNQIISNVVAQSNGKLSLVDTHTYFETLYDGLDLFLNKRADGIVVDGVLFYPGIEKNGIFTSDGLNLNPRGNALIVNKIIESLNSGFNGNIPYVNVNAFSGTEIHLSDN